MKKKKKEIFKSLKKGENIPYHYFPKGSPKGICMEQGKAPKLSNQLNPNILCLIFEKDWDWASFWFPMNIMEKFMKSFFKIKFPNSHQ